MEAVTAYIEGPLCFVIMYGMMKQKPWRFTLQLAVSLGQAYGDVLYFATTCYEGMLSAVCSVHMAPMWCCSASVVAWHDGNSVNAWDSVLRGLCTTPCNAI